MITIKKGLVAFLALSFFFIVLNNQIYAYPRFGINEIQDDYLHFGNNEYPSNSKQSITFSVNESSISFQSIIAFITTEYVAGSTLINQRNITYFYVLANGRVVDMFQPFYDEKLGKFKEHYQLRIALEDWNIGSLVTLQIVAVSTTYPADNTYYEYDYVVAWSEPLGPFQLKAMPVIDREAVNVLEAILSRLSNMSAMLEMKLTQLTKAVEKIYTPLETTEQRLENATNAIKDKLPMDEMIEQVEEANNILKETNRKLQQPGAKIKIGGDFCFIPGVAESCFPVLDLTEFREYVLLFRTIIEASLWVYFFYMIFEKLTPKPRL